MLPSILLLILAMSCNDRLTVFGIVVDSESNRPLDSVSITSVENVSSEEYDWIGAYTQTNGRFQISYSLKTIKEITKIPFVFRKDGYNTVVEMFPRENVSDTIYLIRKTAD